MLAARRMMHRVSRHGSIVDTFNRADSASLGTTSDGKAAWTLQNLGGSASAGIVSNQATLSGSPPAIATIPATSTDAEVQIDLTASQGSPFYSTNGLAFWYTDATHYWILDATYNPSFLQGIFRFDPSLGQTVPVQTFTIPAPPVTLKIVTAGSTFTAYINGVAQTPVTDTTYAPGFDFGFVSFHSGNRFDDFSLVW